MKRPLLIHWSIAAAVSAIALGELFPAGAQTTEKARFAISGMKEGRAQLHSGTCQLSGVINELGDIGKDADLAGPVSYLVAFDRKGNQRFDGRAPGWVIDHGSTTGEKTVDANPDGSRKHPTLRASTSKRGTVAAHFLRTPEKSAFWVEGQEVITLHGPTYKIPRLLHPFDLKAFGIACQNDLSRNLSVQEILGQYLSRPMPVVDERGDGLWELIWSISDRTMVDWRVLVNVKEGFTPIRSQLRERPNASVEWDVTEQSQTEWRQQNGVWVPVYFSNDAGGKGGKFRYSRQLQLTWTDVNGEIDKGLFSIDNFGAPAAVGIVDMRLGDPVTLRPHELPPAGDFRWWKSGWVIGLVVLAAIGLALFVLRHFRPQRSGKKVASA